MRPLVLASLCAASAAGVPAAHGQAPPAGAEEEEIADPWDPAEELERPFKPQYHETRLGMSLLIANRNNSANLSAEYALTPNPLNRNDDVVPMLRRYVRHPTEVRARVYREGSSIDSRTGGGLGGTAYLLGGALVAGGDVAFELDTTHFDFYEAGYAALPYEVFAGGRPLPLLELRAFFKGRPVLYARDGDLPINAERSGGETDVGGEIRWAAATDRLWVIASASRYAADWTFTAPNEGDLTVRGVRAGLFVSWQLTPGMSWFLDARLRLEDWNNERAQDLVDDGVQEELVYIGPETRRDIFGLEGDIGALFWYRGTLGFRVALGGGYLDELPIWRAALGPRELRFGRMMLGLVSRY